MEGANVAQIHVAQFRTDAGLHFFCRAVGEGYAQNVFGRDSQVADKVNVAAYQGARLSAPRSGQNANVAFRALNRVQLFRVEAGKNVVVSFAFGHKYILAKTRHLRYNKLN